MEGIFFFYSTCLLSNFSDWPPRLPNRKFSHPRPPHSHSRQHVYLANSPKNAHLQALLKNHRGSCSRCCALSAHIPGQESRCSARQHCLGRTKRRTCGHARRCAYAAIYKTRTCALHQIRIWLVCIDEPEVRQLRRVWFSIKYFWFGARWLDSFNSHSFNQEYNVNNFLDYPEIKRPMFSNTGSRINWEV